VELVYIHVSCIGVLAAVRKIFAWMKQLLKSTAQESCLVAGLVVWLRVLSDGEESLADWVPFKVQKKIHAVEAEEAEMLRHGDCSHHR